MNMTNGLHIYCIPGLGLNEKVFENLGLNNRVTYLNWLEPQKDEKLSNYAERIASKISKRDTKKVIIGHSFGGVLAQEISNHVHIDRIILVSSIKSVKEIPTSLKMLPRIGLTSLISRGTMLLTFPLWGRFHGYNTKRLRSIFRESVKSLSTEYFQWSIKAIASWEGPQHNQSKISHIHGDADKMFPIGLVLKPVKLVTGGDHIMIYNKGEEVAQLVEREMLE